MGSLIMFSLQVGIIVSSILVAFIPQNNAFNGALPSLELKTRWKTTLEETEFMGYSSNSFTISDNIIYVLNGANIGNAVLKFDLEGSYIGEYPGWFNWPYDIIVGGKGQVLLTALGAMGDDTMLRFGMVMYNSAGDFFHGFHEAETGLKRPQGLSLMPEADNLVAVCDCDNNMTALLEVDWENGHIETVAEIFEIEYPWQIAVDMEKIVVTSMVCCEPWHEEMIKMSIFDITGNLITEVKELPTGDTISYPMALAIQPNGNIWITDGDLLKTLVFSPEGDFIGEMPELSGDRASLPKKMLFHQDVLYALTEEEALNAEDDQNCYMNAYYYQET